MSGEQLLHQYPVVHDMDLRWGDMDAFQHLNNVMYFRYYERYPTHSTSHHPPDLLGTNALPVRSSARIKYMEALSEHLRRHGEREEVIRDLMSGRGIGPIVRSASCIYKRPVVYPDTLAIGVKAIDIKEDRFLLKYLAVSRKNNKVRRGLQLAGKDKKERPRREGGRRREEERLAASPRMPASDGCRRTGCRRGRRLDRCV